MGILFAWICQSTGHAPWAILLLLGCSALVSEVIPIANNPVLRKLTAWCLSQSRPMRAAFVFLLLTMTLKIVQSLGIDPRSYNYLPFLPAVIASNMLFGAGFSLFATVLSLLTADYLYPTAAPASDVFELAWEQIAILAAFGAIGAAFAFLLVSFATVSRHSDREIFKE